MSQAQQPTLFADEPPAVPESSGAVFSGCGLYRYRLWRTWDGGLPSVNWIMLNPSTAVYSIDDPTISRCVGYAKAWGYGGIVVTNLFALRSTNPKALRSAMDPVGPENNTFLLATALTSRLVVGGWGNHGKLNGRSAWLRGKLSRLGVELMCLAVKGNGEPGHPLYLKGDLRPVPFEAKRVTP